MSRYAVSFKAIPLGAGYYVIEHKESKKAYVGSSKFVRSRIQGHYAALTSKTHHSKTLQADFDTGGLDAFNIQFFITLIEIAQIQESRGVEYYTRLGLSYNSVQPSANRAWAEFKGSRLPYSALKDTLACGVF